MNKRNKKTITPPRLAALVTGFGLVACALGSFWLYKVTVYTPILLVGLMLLLQAAPAPPIRGSILPRRRDIP